MKKFKKLTPFKLQVLENFPFIDEDFDASYASNDYDDYICKPIDIIKFDNIIKKLGLLD